MKDEEQEEKQKNLFEFEKESSMTQDKINEIVRAEKARYLREWRKAHPDKVQAANKRYWVKRAAKIAAEQEEQRYAEK